VRALFRQGPRHIANNNAAGQGYDGVIRLNAQSLPQRSLVSWTPPSDVTRGKPLVGGARTFAISALVVTIALVTQVHGIIGLNQMGNTCYLNSAVQCLAQLPPFIQYFTSALSDNSNVGGDGVVAQCVPATSFPSPTISAAIRSLFRQIWDPNIRTVTPRFVFLPSTCCFEICLSLVWQFFLRGLKAAVARKHDEFRGFGQQDVGPFPLQVPWRKCLNHE